MLELWSKEMASVVDLCLVFCTSIAPPKFKNSYIDFLFLPFSVVNEKVLRDACFPPPSSVNEISVYIKTSRNIKTFMLLRATYTESSTMGSLSLRKKWDWSVWIQKYRWSVAPYNVQNLSGGSRFGADRHTVKTRLSVQWDKPFKVRQPFLQ